MLDYIISLAPEGTTVLFLKQLPDGKCIPYSPRRAKIKDGEPWFGNIGLYVKQRFTEGPKAQSRMIDSVWCMMLDDIGTKSATPPLAPTWIIETSPGNHQWVYVFSEAVPKAQFAAALKAIADAGFTDPGANNPVRNFRIPGSLNRRKNFNARLVEFHPERKFTLEGICQAFNVQPGEASGDVLHLDLKDDGRDDVLAWLNAEGYLLDPPNAAGWASVLCPNHAEHSNDDTAGRYFPASRAFKCMHAHCLDWDSQRYLKWVAKQGGPAHDYGLRDELLAAKLAPLASLTPTDAFPDEAAAAVARVERQELSRVERAQWHFRIVYVVSDDAYFDLQTRRLYSRKSFDALFRHVECRSIHSARQVTASHSFDETRADSGAKVAMGQTYAPGKSDLVEIDSDVYVNKWRDKRMTFVPGDVSPWLRHLERVVPEEAEREHMLDVMAFKLQNPGIKINHGILLIGYQGIGKDTVYAPFLQAIGNVITVENHKLQEKWGYNYECEVMVLQELRMAEARDRRGVENHLKPILAAPPEYLMVEKKGAHPYPVLNRMLVLAGSNHAVPLTLPSDDRRWFVVKSPVVEKFEGRALWDWYARGGASAVGAFLMARDVSAFDPGAPAPWTDAKATLIESGMSVAESRLVDLMRARQGIFEHGVVGGPWQAVCDVLSQPGMSVYVPTLMQALQDAGWLDRGRCHSRRFPSNRPVWCAPELASASKSELRDLVERPGGKPGLRLAVDREQEQN